MSEGYVFLFMLLWFVSLLTVLYFWWQRRKARLAAGENFLNDARYQLAARKKNYVDIACVGLFLLWTISGIFAFRKSNYGFVEVHIFFLWVGSILAFIILWWKKRKARISAGENYSEDSTYKKISKYKRIVGVASVSIFIFMFQYSGNPNLLLTSEEIEKVETTQKEFREKFVNNLNGEEKNFYDEKLAAYISEGKTEDNAKKFAVRDVQNKRFADRKAEEEKLAAEKKTAEEKVVAEKVEQKKSEPDLIDKAKEKVKDLATNEIDKLKQEAENITADEIYIGDYNLLGLPLSLYVLPKTVRPYIYGIIFETDEGFQVNVKMKDPNTGQTLFEEVYAFDNNNNILEDESNVKYWLGDVKPLVEVKLEPKGSIEKNKAALEIYRVSKKFSLLT